MSTSLLLSEMLAATALRHYETVLPAKKGKPKDNEWTVYAALLAVVGPAAGDNDDGNAAADHHHNNTSTTKTTITAADDDGKIWVVTCATGTKCTGTAGAGASASAGAGAGAAAGDTTATTASSCCTRRFILRDSHAEVLVRRGLVRVLWNEILEKTQASCVNGKKNMSNNNRWLLDEEDEEDGSDAAGKRFRLRPDVTLHLYVSDSPCGDASIYRVNPISSEGVDDAADADADDDAPQFTGAKIIVARATGVSANDCGGEQCLLMMPTTFATASTTTTRGDVVLAREDVQLLGKLRTKSGRSNLDSNQRSFSMSCSDKLVRWSVLGLQGVVLMAHYISTPIRLTSILVSRDGRQRMRNNSNEDKDAADDANDEQLCALRRAIPDRVEAVAMELMKHGASSDGVAEFKKNAAFESFVKDLNPPSISIVKATFSRGKTSVAAIISSNLNDGNKGLKRKRPDTEVSVPYMPNKNVASSSSPSSCSPTGLSISWIYNNNKNNEMGDPSSLVEVIVGARGILHGKKPKSLQDYETLQSRLCRAALVKCAHDCGVRLLKEDHCSNSEWKRRACASSIRNNSNYNCYCQARELVFQQGPLSGWLVGDAMEGGGVT